MGFDVGHVPAVGQNRHVGLKQLGDGTGSIQGNDVSFALQQNGWYLEPGQLGPEIVIAQTGPDFLLGAAGYPEGREVMGPGRIEEVGGHGKLERTLSVGRRVMLPKSTGSQVGSLLLQRRIKIPLLKPSLELPPGFTPGG